MLKNVFTQFKINRIPKKGCTPKKEIIVTQIDGIETFKCKNSLKNIRKSYYSLGERLIRDGWYYR